MFIKNLTSFLLFSFLFSIFPVNSVFDYFRDFDNSISKLLNEEIDAKNIENNLKLLTKTVHRAGTRESLAVAQLIHDKFVEFGLDKVETAEYDVLLSYPNDTQPDHVSIVDDKGAVVVDISNGTSDFLTDEEKLQSNANVRFNAYAHTGSVTSSKIVYANYGRLEDLDFIEKRLNISLNGTIALIKYGKIFRGDKIKNAETRGVAGVLLYTDPMDYSKNCTNSNETYPNSLLMPPNGVQRGTLIDTGDTLTPLLPANGWHRKNGCFTKPCVCNPRLQNVTNVHLAEFVIRRQIEDMYDKGILCKIPVTPISYSDAYKILCRLSGRVAPHSWQGGFKNITYKIGPTLNEANRFIKMTVTTHLKSEKIKNVIGYLKGSIEPDRYVIIGNHHDSWVYGAVDPSSATAVLLDLVKAFTNVVKQTGWRPRRTIVFCAWDGEEYGIIGSSEYVEQYLRRLEFKTVAYLNVDSAVSGRETLSANSVPLLRQTLFEAARMVPNPDPSEIQAGRTTVFDTWLFRLADRQQPSVPWINFIGSGSDYRHFLHYAGISSLDFRYANVKDRSYPLYHTLHETMYLMKNFMDPNFKFHQSIGRVWSQVALLLSDSLILPFNVTDYSKILKECVKSLGNTIDKKYQSMRPNISVIINACETFENATSIFQNNYVQLKQVENKKQNKIKSVNDRLQFLERMFILPGGLPQRPYLRHVIFAPSEHDAYSGVTYAGILDTLAEMSKTANIKQLKKLKIVLNDQISWAATCIHSASEHLLNEW